MGDKSPTFIRYSLEPQHVSRVRHSACDRCRMAKVRCNGERPSCERCETLMKSCTYTTTKKPRHSEVQCRPRAPGSYIFFEGPAAGSPPRSRESQKINESTQALGGFQFRNSTLSPPSSLSKGADLSSAVDSNDADSTLWGEDDISQNFCYFAGDTRPGASNVAFLQSDQSPSSGLEGFLFDFGASSVTGDDSATADATTNASGLVSLNTNSHGVTSDHTSHGDITTQPPTSHEPSNSSHDHSAQDSTGTSAAASRPNFSLESAHKGLPDANPSKNQHPGGCNCLLQLTSSLFNLNHWSSGGGMSSSRTTAGDTIGIDTFLVLYKDSMDKWVAVKTCKSGCFLRLEYAVLLMMNVEQLAKLQIGIMATVANVKDGGDEPSSALTRGPSHTFLDRSKRDNQLESSPRSSTACRQPMSIGKFVIDSASDKSTMVTSLLKSRKQQLNSFTKSLRPMLVQAGLNECCTKLDDILETLEKTA